MCIPKPAFDATPIAAPILARHHDRLAHSTPEVVAKFKAWGGIAAITRSAEGCVIMKGGDVHYVPAAPVAEVVDTTGAGDLFAAGFLFGITHGKSLEDCGRLGSLAAAEVISHYGARPETSLKALAEKAKLL